jgi:hypothetical protein
MFLLGGLFLIHTLCMRGGGVSFFWYHLNGREVPTLYPKFPERTEQRKSHAPIHQTGKNRIKRFPQRGHYDQETIYRILDEALICHIGFVEKGHPFVIPINFARQELPLSPIRDGLQSKDVPLPEYITQYSRTRAG